MKGAIHAEEPVWVNEQPTRPTEIRAGDKVESTGARRARVEKARRGQGQGTVWLHGASGACIRCLHDERVAVYVDGRRRFRRAAKVAPGDLIMRLVGGRLTIDPVIAIRTLTESVPAVYLEMPSVSLLSEEGFLCRLSLG